ncbi:MAG: RagB/SusD family nutrient uptake outer membrane protein [Bacteroidaceae bacterium]|nr:RagB/SusD family nutrient uptake outer membrane protein [Bacteroidaceae bacterium]
MKLLKLLYLLPVTLLCCSCGDYLNKLPENKVATSTVDYTDLSNLYAPVSGVYAKIRTDAAHWIIWGSTIIRDDDVAIGKTGDQTYLDAIDQSYGYDASFWGLNTAWNNYYGVIQVANGALESLDNYAENITSTTDKENYLSYCGEVRFLRAYAYYRLVQLFGPVTILRTNDQSNMTRTTVESVYNYALEDLEYAYENLPKERPNEMAHSGAVTAYTAEMLMAKIYLNEGNYTKVQSLTQDIIDSNKFSLYDDYYELFKIPGKLCNESLFEYQATDFGNSSGDVVNFDVWFPFQGPINTGIISGWGFISPTKSFIDWAVKRGETVRATTTFLYTGQNTPSGDWINAATGNNPTCYNGKAYLPSSELTSGRTDYGCNNNIRVFRYAEVLLMNAEAKIRNGENGDKEINLVRERAKMSDLTNATINDVLDERRMELGVEWGERFNDLVRTGQAETVLGNLGYTSDKEYYPIPNAAIDISPELANDPVSE